MTDDALKPGDANESADSEDEGEDELDFLRAGRLEARLCRQLIVSLRVARLYDLDNVVALDAIADLAAVLQSYLARRDKAVILLGEHRRVYVNGRMVRSGRSGAGWVEDLVDHFGKHGIGGLLMTGEWAPADVTLLLEIFRRVAREPAEEKVEIIARGAREIGPLAHVEVFDVDTAQAAAEEEEEGHLGARQRAIFYFARLVSLAEASNRVVVSGGSPDTYARHVRQTVMKLVDGLKSELFEHHLIALTARRPGGDQLAVHAANVTIHAVCMGRLLGLPRGPLADLGYAALYHDIGAAGLKREAAPAGDREDDSTRERHVAQSVAVCLRGRSYNEAALLRLAGCQEHHRSTEQYPRDQRLRDPHLFSRIVGAADRFDRVEHGSDAWDVEQGPTRALQALRNETRLDEPVVDLLESVLGRYPRGSALRLNDGTTAVVIDGGARFGNRPIVRVVLDDQLDYLQERPLRQIDEADVVKELSPERHGLDWRTIPSE